MDQPFVVFFSFSSSSPLSPGAEFAPSEGLLSSQLAPLANVSEISPFSIALGTRIESWAL